jgi:hypothetical protein
MAPTILINDQTYKYMRLVLGSDFRTIFYLKPYIKQQWTLILYTQTK